MPPVRKLLLRNTITGITKPAIQRLAHKGGAKYLSGLVYEETRGLAKVFLEDVIQKAVFHLETKRRRIITSEFVLESLKLVGQKVYGAAVRAHQKRCKPMPAPKPRQKPAKRGTRSLQQIKYLQKQHGCVNLAKAPFYRLVKEITKDYNRKALWSANAVAILQEATEAHFTGLYKNATLAAAHAKRQVVKPKNLHLVRRIRGEWD